MENIFQEEANARNYILTIQHKRLPSYCLWMDIDIKKETIKNRLNWWKTIEKGNKEKNEVISKWINYLENSNARKINEFCSKRNPNELYCDI